ncbi:MAG: alkaline phosphatase family protein [Gammaproteobacteria bacterium]|nr:alkaline phosphatase family protein [Gammaproteobacteria bacterium]
MKNIHKLTVSLAALALSACSGSPGGPLAQDDPPPPGPSGENALTVVVVAIDSLMPEDVDATTMPNVNGLITNGTYFLESRSVFSAETIPNHVAMMTGVYPDRNGIPTNNFWDKDALPGNPGDEDLDNPNELEAKTLFTWIDEQCRQGLTTSNPDIRHAAVLSKTYLWEVFRGDDADSQTNDAGINNIEPDTHWDPQSSPSYIGPGSEHTPDPATGPEAVATLPAADFIFINLGDVDRSAHASGSTGRQGTRSTADQQIGNIISALQDADRWDNTVFIISSDHGMDFSAPEASEVGPGFPQDAPLAVGPAAGNYSGDSISTQPLLDDLAACTNADVGTIKPMLAVQNGGTNSIVITDLNSTAAEREGTMLAARACLMNFTGENTATDAPASCESVVGTSCFSSLTQPVNIRAVEHAWYANPDLYTGSALNGALVGDTGGAMPATIKSRHENLGDLVLAISDGFKFSEPDASGNPIPGNHGHMPTIHNTIIVSGGASFLVAGNAVDSGNDDHFVRDPGQSENIDVAPTVAWLLGLDIQDGQFPDAGNTFPDYGDAVSRSGFDGRVLSEAFNITDSPSNCGLLPE